jgi:hypothetical protein
MSEYDEEMEKKRIKFVNTRRVVDRRVSGFIVHPWETCDGKYSASYGDHNATAKSFNSLTEAKRYLARSGIQKAMYDSPSGNKDINLVRKPTRKAAPSRPQRSRFLGMFGFG